MTNLMSAKTRPRADCGSDHELCIAKFRLKVKKVGKTTRALRYDLNEIPFGGDEKIQRFRSDRQCLKNYGQRFITLYRRL